jgi:hypothetical protein
MVMFNPKKFKKETRQQKLMNENLKLRKLVAELLKDKMERSVPDGAEARVQATEVRGVSTGVQDDGKDGEGTLEGMSQEAPSKVTNYIE